MRLRSLLVTFAVGGMAAAYGQSASPLRITPDQSNGGRGSLKVRNTADVTVTAFVVSFDLPAPAGPKKARLVGRKLYDAATEPLAAKPIPAGQEVAASWPFNGLEPQPEAKVEAVLFVDGTSWGDPEWVRRIKLRRKHMERSLTDSLADLVDAVIHNAERGQVISSFQSASNREQEAASDPDQRDCIRSVREVVLRNLKQVTQNVNGTPASTKEVLLRQIESLRSRLTAVERGGGNLVR